MILREPLYMRESRFLCGDVNKNKDRKMTKKIINSYVYLEKEKQLETVEEKSQRLQKESLSFFEDKNGNWIIEDKLKNQEEKDFFEDIKTEEETRKILIEFEKKIKEEIEKKIKRNKAKGKRKKRKLKK